MWASIVTILTRAAVWVAPSLISWVASDIMHNHEQRQTNDTIKEVAASAAGAARLNWVKWLAFAFVGMAVAIALAFFFRFKFKSK